MSRRRNPYLFQLGNRCLKRRSWWAALAPTRYAHPQRRSAAVMLPALGGLSEALGGCSLVSQQANASRLLIGRLGSGLSCEGSGGGGSGRRKAHRTPPVEPGRHPPRPSIHRTTPQKHGAIRAPPASAPTRQTRWRLGMSCVSLAFRSRTWPDEYLI